MNTKSILFNFLIVISVISIFSCSKKEEPVPTPTIKEEIKPPIKLIDYAEIKYETFDEAMTASSKDGKPVYIFLKAEWCAICNGIRRANLKNKDIINLVMNYYHPVMIDYDDDSSKYTFDYCRNNTITYFTGALQYKIPAEIQAKANLKNLPTQYFIKSLGKDEYKVDGLGGDISSSDHKKLLDTRKSM